jgi:hypothetical protein
LKREDAAGYLQHRRKQGFNAIALVAINPAEKTNAYGAAPFEVKNGRMDPAQPLIQGKDNYWTHLDYILSEMRRLGLYAILLPTWGSAVAGDYNGKPNVDVIFDASNAYVYGRWIGARYGRHPHIIWMLGGDRSAVPERWITGPFFAQWQRASKKERARRC